MYYDAPYDQKQWWIFNRRTRSIRPVTKRSHAITVYDGNNNWPRLKKYAILTRYRRQSSKPWYYQATYYHGKRANIRNPSGYCLGMWGGRTSVGAYASWSRCTSASHMAWRLDRRGIRYPRYPMRSGRKFQIKSTLRSRRPLIYYNRSGHQWYLRIVNNNPYNIKQWWVFDWRTKTIRAAGNRSLVISIQMNGKNWRYYNYYGMVRKYRRESIQKMRWFNGRYNNIRDLGHRCLNVQSDYDAHHRYVMFYKCQKRKGSGWHITTKGYNYPKYPLANGVKFQIRSRMHGNKALFWWEHIGGHQYRTRIQAHDPTNKRQWWTFDSRTRTVRPILRRNYVLANQRGVQFRINYAAVIRVYKGSDNTVQTRWYNGSRRNVQNNGRKCMQVHGNVNRHWRHVIFYNCNNNLSQAWYIDQRGPLYRRHPYRDGVKFQIRTKMGSGRSIFWYNHIGSNQWHLRLQTHQPFNGKQWFIFDRRTQSVRAW